MYELICIGASWGGLHAVGQVLSGIPEEIGLPIVLAQHRHPQQMLRVDYEDPSEIDSACASRLLDRVTTALDGAAALCLEDYNKGLLTEDVCRRVVALAKAKHIPVFVDPYALEDYSKYGGATAG